jgi:hypothetical protein
MLWYKSWLDTRWRFLIGLALLVVSACGTVFSYTSIQEMLPALEARELPGAIGEAVREELAGMRTYSGYVWSQWFEQNFSMLATIFAALLGSGGPFLSGRGVLFSLALPVSRGRWVSARATMGLVQLLALGLLPSLAIVALSPLVGERFGAGDAIVHALCVFVVASVFFGVASLLSTVFNDVWRPLLLTCLLAFVAALAERVLPNEYGLFNVMSAADYHGGGSLPWVGLSLSALLTAALLYSAAASTARRDF